MAQILKRSGFKIGNAHVELVHEIKFHEVISTEIIVGGERVCTIVGSDIQAFIEEINRVVEKYRTV